jgi:solute carrier family 35 protein F1/2
MQGVFICCVGMGLLVTSDQTQNSPGGPGKSMIKGDLFMIAGATLYGFSELTKSLRGEN